MRGLALARYRLLTTIRSAWWVYATLMACAAVPIILGTGLFKSPFDAWQSVAERMFASATVVTGVYLMHVIVIVLACNAFGTPRPAIEGRPAADLTETVPITPRERFLGDAAGILGCILAVHACTVPLLALAVVLSPLPTAVFFWLELITLAIAVLSSAGASWKLRSSGRWIRTRTARSIATFGILLAAILGFNTRSGFTEAFVWFFLTQPSTSTWRAVEKTVPNPSMLFASLLLLYLGFISYYTLQSIRSLERQ